MVRKRGGCVIEKERLGSVLREEAWWAGGVFDGGL